MLTKRLSALLAIVCMLCGWGAVHAGSVGSLPKYNLFVAGDLTNSSEVEGATFVGGDLSGPSSNYGIRLGTSPIPDALVVGGDITGNPKQVFGNAVAGGSVSATLNFNTGGTLRSETIDAASLTQQVQDASDYYASLSSNASVTVPGTQPGAVKFQANGSSPVAVFDVSLSDLFSNKTQQIELDLNGADMAVINVSGTSALWQSGNMVGDLISEDVRNRVLWNFYQADSLTFNNALYGSLLAPNAHFQNATMIEGNVYVSSMDKRGEVHLQSDVPFTQPPNNSAVPSPTAALFGAGLLSLVACRRRRKQA